jgi:hypothetical protein
MNRIEFAIITGRPAKDDDLERVNCKRAGTLGTFGHWNCGVCVHGVPMIADCDLCVQEGERIRK